MTLGLYSHKGDIDNRAGRLSADLRGILADIGTFKVWLDTQADPDLIDYGYSVPDIAVLRSTFVDLDKLREIYLGLDDQTPAYDFQTFAKRVG